MKIKLDLTDLVRLGRIMMPEGSGFSLGRSTTVFEPIDVALGVGKEISLDDLDESTGLLSVEGRQVVLYIKDHTNRFEAALQDGARGNRFHIAHCQTLEDMKRKNRYQRYVATNRLDGIFPIEGSSGWGGQSQKGEARLKVCKYCLQRLNYKNSADYAARQRNFDTFSFAEFFSRYSTCFKYMPTMLNEKASVGYTADWSNLSKTIRQAESYICDKCGIDLSKNKNLCDVHHINGVKSDNRRENLRVLCKDCHRKQPMHDGIFISAANMEIIRNLRLQQNRLKVTGWESAFDLSDMSVHGDMALLQKKGYPPPVVGYDLLNNAGEVFVTLEVAWPDRRVGINLDRADIPGWNVYLVGEVSSIELSGMSR